MAEQNEPDGDLDAMLLDRLHNLILSDAGEVELFVSSLNILVSDPSSLSSLMANPAQRKYLLSRGLFIAAELDWAKGAQLLIRNGAETDITTDRGETPLHCAINGRHEKVANYICHHVKDWSKRSRSGESTLDLACRLQMPDLIQSILNIIMCKVERAEARRKLLYTALIAAIETENCDIVRLLIKGGTDINLNLDPDTGPPLRVACELGNIAMVDFLICAGADIEATCRRLHQTPLMCASEYGHAGVIERLLEAGAEIDRQTDQCSTALTLACHFGYLDVVNVLLEKGASPHVRNRWGFTPLFMAADSPEIVKRLLPLNVDINEICGERGEAAIHLASVVGNRETVEVMLEAGGHIDIQTWQNETCIWLAAWKGHQDLARLLLQLNCSKDVPSNGCQVYAWDYTPLELALGSGQYEIAKMLLKAGAKYVNPVYFTEDGSGPDPAIPWFKIRPEVMDFAVRSPETHKWVTTFLRNPRTLKDVCISFIRNKLGKSIVLRNKTDGLPLPGAMKEQVLLESL